MEPLEATLCKGECGQIMVPPEKRCVNCGGGTEQANITDRGKILTFTILHSVPEGFDAPLVLGLIALEADAASIGELRTGSLKLPNLVCVGKVPMTEMAIGLEVRLRKNDNGYYFEKTS